MMVLATALANTSFADDVKGLGSEVAIWIPPTLWHPVLVFVLVVVAPEVIGWCYSNGFRDQEIVKECRRIMAFDMGGGRSMRVEVLMWPVVSCSVCLILLVALGFNPPQTPVEALRWRHLVDLWWGCLIIQWLLVNGCAWSGAVDLVEGRRRREAKLRRLARDWEERMMRKRVQEGVREISRVVRGVRRERREKLREESMRYGGGAAGRGCGRGGGRVGGRLGLRSETVKMDPVQTAWELAIECHQRLGLSVKSGDDTAFELRELKGWEHRVEQAMLKLDDQVLSGDGSVMLRQQRKSALLALDAMGEFIETLIEVARYQKKYPKRKGVIE